MKHVILCDKKGNSEGTEEILKAHQNGGALHKAFSIFVFRNNRDEVLLQKRSSLKPLFPLFWANTCCSHPQEGEDIVESAQKRLQEEMGFTCPLTALKSFVYQADDPSGELAEHEYDTILVADIEEVEVQSNPDEVEEWKWMSLSELLIDIDENPETYAPWFLIALSHIFDGN